MASLLQSEEVSEILYTYVTIGIEAGATGIGIPASGISGRNREYDGPELCPFIPIPDYVPAKSLTLPG